MPHLPVYLCILYITYICVCVTFSTNFHGKPISDPAILSRVQLMPANGVRTHVESLRDKVIAQL